MKSGIFDQTSSSVWDSLDPELRTYHFEPFLAKGIHDDGKECNLITNQSLVDDSLFEWFNYTDSQLEDIILAGNLDLENLCIDDVLPEEKQPQQQQPKLEEDLVPEFKFDSSVVDNVANYEEVLTYHDSPHTTTNSTEYDGTDSESVCSFESNHSKRKLSVSVEESPKKRRRAAKTRYSTKRNLDQRVKNQNKIAAKKYRIKKREEKTSLEEQLQLEEERHKQLSELAEEKKNEINVLKELLGKYLSAQQLSKYSLVI